jgi:pyruvate/2-oxoglutarate dehydrogenase complex dihydrolipoamide dehydrogenase (E3) component
MAEHYDVIVIGTGAGGRSPIRSLLRASGSCSSSAAASY